MPRILKRGSLPNDRFYVCTCDHCGTVTEFKKKEGASPLKGASVDVTDGTEMIEFKCPLCNDQLFATGPGNITQTDSKQLLTEMKNAW